MKTIAERLTDARKKREWTQQELANMAKVSQASIGHLEAGTRKTSRSITLIAEALGVEPLWLAEGKGPRSKWAATDTIEVPPTSSDPLEISDSNRKNATIGDNLIGTYTSSTSPHDEKTIAISQFHDSGGAMGSGLVLHDQPGEITSWTVTPEWIQKNIKSHTGVGNLCIVTGFGNSMQPLYNPGDPLIVDRGITTVDFDATYFFRVGDSGFVKILQRIPGEGIRVISKNKDFEPWTIKPGMDFQVFGQVLKAWCGTDI